MPAGVGTTEKPLQREAAPRLPGITRRVWSNTKHHSMQRELTRARPPESNREAGLTVGGHGGIAGEKVPGVGMQVGQDQRAMRVSGSSLLPGRR